MGGYTLTNDDKTISYVEPTTFTFEGLADSAKANSFTIDEKTSTIVIGSTLVKASGTITMTDAPDGYTLARSAKETAPSTAAALDGTNYTVKYSSEGYELNGNTIKYVKKNGTALKLSGIASQPTDPDDKVVTLQAANFGDNVAVKSNAGGYSFSIASGTYTGKTFTGSSSADTITSAGAKLTINAGKGDDSIVSSGKNVTINGGAGDDYIQSTGSGSSVLGGAGADTISGSSSADKLYGDAGNDSLFGGKGADSLYGGAGNDTLWGGAGNDTLIGGAEADTFIYKPNEGNDVITDYSYDDGDILQILNTNGTEASYESSFASNTLTLTIDGGGTLVLNNVNSGDKVNVNGTKKTIGSNGLK